MTSPSGSRAKLPLLLQPFRPTREYLERGPQLSARTQAELQRYREFNRPAVPTSSGLENWRSYRGSGARYTRYTSPDHPFRPAAGDSWRRYDEPRNPTYTLHDLRRPSLTSRYEWPPLQLPFPEPERPREPVPSTQAQYTSYFHSRPSTQPLHPSSRRGSSPQLRYAPSQNLPYPRPAASRPHCSPYLHTPPLLQPTYPSSPHERSPQRQHLLSDSSAQPSGGPYLEPEASQSPDPSHLQPRTSVSPHPRQPPPALNSSHRLDISSILSYPYDRHEVKKYPLDWFLREAQHRGIDVKAILINLLFPELVQSSNRPHLLRDENLTGNREHRLFDGGRDPSPGNSKRRRVESSYEQGGDDRNENLSIRQSPGHGSGVTGEPAAARSPTLQSTRTRITLGDSGSSHSVSDRGGTESGKESARHDESNSHDETTRHDEITIQDKRDENSKSIEKRTNQDESSSRTTNHDENLNHDGSATNSNTTTGGSEVSKSPIFRKTKTRGKRKLNTILSNDNNDSGPSSSKRLKTGGYDESTCDTGRHHGNDRSTGSKVDPKNHTDNHAGRAAGSPTHDNNANVASCGLSVPLRRSARKRKMRVRGS